MAPCRSTFSRTTPRSSSAPFSALSPTLMRRERTEPSGDVNYCNIYYHSHYYPILILGLTSQRRMGAARSSRAGSTTPSTRSRRCSATRGPGGGSCPQGPTDRTRGVEHSGSWCYNILTSSVTIFYKCVSIFTNTLNKRVCKKYNVRLSSRYRK